jgi:hypothetical protein
LARAPADRVDYLLDHYGKAGDASRQVSTAVGWTATAARVPSRTLLTARTAVAPEYDGIVTGSPADPAAAEAAIEPDALPPAERSPGPVERTLVELGVTHPERLKLGAEIDQAGERLIIRAAEELGPERRGPDATALSRSRGTATLVNHALQSGDLRAASLLRIPTRRNPEREPEP